METVKLVTAAQMRAIEQSSVEAGVSLDELMENAGLVIAREIQVDLDQLGSADVHSVVILIGPGNNGSDGFVAGRHLAAWGINVTAVISAARKSPDPKRKLAEAAGVAVVDGMSQLEIDALDDFLMDADFVVDAILGTGTSRPIGEPIASLLRSVEEAAVPVIAIDLPTGMNADTGAFDPNGLRADITLMLGNPKLGAAIEMGAYRTGISTVLDIGIPPGLDTHIQTELLNTLTAVSDHPQRPADGHKGTFGSTLIIGGSLDFLGAVTMATGAATRSGVGLTFVATPESAFSLIAGDVPEAMYRSLPESGSSGNGLSQDAARMAVELSTQATSVVIGPGLGQTNDTREFLKSLLSEIDDQLALVLDADALNILATSHKWWEWLANPAILTPHPGELARLLRTSTAEVQSARVSSALDAARKFNKVVILKGSATLIASPDGRLRVASFVNSGLAKGGSGDVLAGLLGGLVAQAQSQNSEPLGQSELFDMASLAVFIHGYAANSAREEIGETGMRATDVTDRLGHFYRDLLVQEDGEED